MNNKEIYIINFWTNEWFENNTWDKYYCKTFESMKIKLESLLLENNFSMDEDIQSFRENININDELYINITIEELN